MVDKQEIRKRFARSLGSYDSAAAVQRDMAEALCDLLTLATGERQFEKIVELGSGTGILTDLVMERFDYDSLTLIDLVPECEVFHRNRPRTTFRAGDIETAELPEAELYLSNATIQWAHDPEALLKRIAGQLQPGGLFAFSSFAPGTLREIAAVTGHGLNYLTQREVLALLEQTGFEPLACHEEEYTQFFPSPLEALRSLKSTGVTAVGSGEPWTRKRLAEFTRCYLEQFQQPEGDVSLTYRPLLFIARKRLQ